MNMTDFPLVQNTGLAGSRIPATDDFIKSRIFTVRGVQVMLDRDLAKLYGVTTKRLNEQVKRNMARFPASFRFSLSKEEMDELVANCDRLQSMKHSSVPMSAFTEHGIIMLASVLKSDIAISVSIRITNAFVAMRKALASVAPILSRLDVVERRQIADQSRNEERFDTIFRAMDGGDFPQQKVFFEGKHYDAYSFAKKLVRKAAKNKQNPTLTVKAVGAFHDRFLILDDKELYHFGASLKDLGRQYCAVTKMDAMFIPSILERI